MKCWAFPYLRTTFADDKLQTVLIDEKSVRQNNNTSYQFLKHNIKVLLRRNDLVLS